MHKPTNIPSNKEQGATLTKSLDSNNEFTSFYKDQRPHTIRIAQLQQLANVYSNPAMPPNLQNKNYNPVKPASHGDLKTVQLRSLVNTRAKVKNRNNLIENSHFENSWKGVQDKNNTGLPATQLKQNIEINDDAGLEKEADIMGHKAMQLKVITSGEKVISRGPELGKLPVTSLVYQRKKEVIQFGNKVSTTDEDAILETEYKEKVKEAIARLDGKIGFGASPEGKFDARYWKKIDDPKYHFAIETKVKPSVALKHLFNAPQDVWKFDCAEYIQVCNLYATMEVYGEEAVDQKGTLILRQHSSTPFEKSGVTFDRNAKDNQFDAIFPKADNAVGDNFIGEVALLQHIPAGTRVCFKNPAAPETPFRNENAIYLGGGKYAAHPMGSGLSAQNIIDKLVSYNEKSGLGGDDHGRAQIFISQVEIYASIPMGKNTVEGLGLTKYEKLL